MKYNVKKGYIIQQIGKKTTIFDAEESYLYTLSEVGSVIFKKIKAGWSREMIVELILQKYKVKKEQCERDVDEFISDLKESNILSEGK